MAGSSSAVIESLPPDFGEGHLDQDGWVSLNPPTQYATDANLRARQRLWEYQQPPFDLVSWVLELAGLGPGSTQRVLDVGCGNGLYLAQLGSWSISATGCDLSKGMLASASATGLNLVNADVTRLPFPASAFDVVLAPHMLYHVDNRAEAAVEMRRVTRPGGRCVVVTNGADHLQSLRSLVESAVRKATPGWEMRNPSTHAFSLDNGEDQLRSAFGEVACLHATASAPVVLTDASVAADYVASVGDHYQADTTRPWSDVVDDVRGSVQRQIDANGSFVVHGHSGAFICT
jgi:SAM-dependent methyltransferase